MDPIAEDFAHVSVYNYSENEPIAHVDLWGLQKADAVHWTSVEKRMVRKGGGNPALVDAFMDGAGKVGQVVLINTGAGDAITIFVGASEGNLNDVAQGTYDLFGGRVLKPFKAVAKLDIVKKSSKYEDITTSSRGSRSTPNKLTDVTKSEFETNLEKSGYQKTGSKDGKASIFTKDGNKYTTRNTSRDYNGPSADFKNASTEGKKPDLKIRLQEDNP